MVFEDPADYDRIDPADRLSLPNLEASLKPEQPLTVHARRKDGSSYQFKTRHTMNAQQIEWFKAGSALNILAST